jgi:NAD(P)-dependent dehydrogenase (short-subunit alcohol dehydrogenase family)
MPGSQAAMLPHPLEVHPDYRPANKLKGKSAIVTGGDSGIGRSVALLFAQEGADVSIVYLNEHEDADRTARRISDLDQRALSFSGDIADTRFCERVVRETLDAFGKVDVLVNNAAEQKQISGIEDLTPDQVERTFRTNIFAFFYLTRALLPHLRPGAAIINTASVQAYDPDPYLMDYACTKAAIVNFTRSLAKQLVDRQIRVNAVAPGPIWTPLIPASFSEEHVNDFGGHTPMKRPGQPGEVAPSFVFLASSADSSYVTGQTLHVNGGSDMIS